MNTDDIFKQAPEKTRVDAVIILKELSTFLLKNNFSAVSVLIALRVSTTGIIVGSPDNSLVQRFKEAVIQKEIDAT